MQSDTDTVLPVFLSQGREEELRWEEGKLAWSAVAFQVKFCDTLRL